MPDEVLHGRTLSCVLGSSDQFSAFRISFAVQRERGRPSVLVLVRAISKATVSDEEAVVGSESSLPFQQVPRLQVVNNKARNERESVIFISGLLWRTLARAFGAREL